MIYFEQALAQGMFTVVAYMSITLFRFSLPGRKRLMEKSYPFRRGFFPFIYNSNS